MDPLTFIAICLILFTGPDGQKIELNQHDISSIRTIRGTDHFGKDVHCNIFMTDGRPIGVAETCEEVHKRIQRAKQEHTDENCN
jgi:uncharacterized protein YlzI (FlbEa/FlbD family)